MLSFLFVMPTWWINQIKDDELHFFIWDTSLLACKSLIPSMGYCLVENRILKTVFALYFGLTTFNLIDIILMYYFEPETWTMILKISLAGLIVIYLMCRMWKDEGAFRDE